VAAKSKRRKDSDPLLSTVEKGTTSTAREVTHLGAGLLGCRSQRGGCRGSRGRAPYSAGIAAILAEATLGYFGET
jgi:hypothetical protein